MKIRKLLFVAAMAFCSVTWGQNNEKLIIVNEGLWQSNNGRLSYFENGNMVSNRWYEEINHHALGDTPSDIIQINDNLVAITVNGSNIVQFITPEGKDVAANEEIPNCRRLASDGKYVYVTSYAHECTVNGITKNFVKGYVAKIDISNFKVVAATEVGYEPDGIAFYKGCLFVANTGGYSYQEAHEYERTVSVLDAESMEVKRTVNTGCMNLFGKISRSGQYLCINSAGDYYSQNTTTLIFDCQAAIDGKADTECFKTFDYSSTYNTVSPQGLFYVIGSHFSFTTGQYKNNYITINPEKAFGANPASAVTETLPGTMVEDISKFKAPYGIYVNPYTGYLYATDAGDYVSNGTLYQWNPEGKYVGKWSTYINPAYFLALPPDGHFGAVDDIIADEKRPVDNTIYNLQGIPVTQMIPGQIYIQNGRKFIYREN